MKRLQANGMKPTIIEDSDESDEDAIITAKDPGKIRGNAPQSFNTNKAHKDYFATYLHKEK